MSSNQFKLQKTVLDKLLSKNIVFNNNIDIEKYDIFQRYEFICGCCNNIWKARLERILYTKAGCPVCTNTMKKSIIDSLFQMGYVLVDSTRAYKTKDITDVRCIDCGNIETIGINRIIYDGKRCSCKQITDPTKYEKIRQSLITRYNNNSIESKELREKCFSNISEENDPGIADIYLPSNIRKYIKSRSRYIAAIKKLGGVCEQCGFDLVKNYGCAEFHHVTDKTATIGKLSKKVGNLLY